MFLLARLLLMLAAAGGICSLTIVGMATWPASGYAALPFLIALAFRRRASRLTTLGSASWASADELRRAGMLDVDAGLIVGRLPAMRRLRGGSIAKLIDLRASSKEACLAFWAGLRCKGSDLVRLARATHVLVVGPTGGGKGRSCIIPFLLTCPDSCLVLDFKGENYLRTARQRRKWFGHRIVVLDPFKIVTQRPDTFNALDAIGEACSFALDHCNDLAKALVVRTGEEREPHFNDTAEFFIAAVIATVVKYGGRENARSLQAVRDVLSHPQRLELAVKLMCESDAWGGMLARMGGQLLHFVEKEKASTLTTAGRHLRFLDTLAVADSTRTSSFDPAELRRGKMTVYLVIPPEHMRAQMGLMRLWIGSMLKAVVAGGLQERNKVHVILDEAASLGHLETIDDAIDKYRGYGVRLQCYFQSLGQLRKCFPDGQDQVLLSNTTQVFFGVNDNATADYVSARIGESTIVVDSGGTSSGTSNQWSEGVQPTTGGGSSNSRNTNWQQQARKLLKPEEVMTLGGRTAITFAPGIPPICTTLLRYDEERRGFGRRVGWLRRMTQGMAVLAMSAALCAASLAVAATLTDMMNRRASKVERGPAKQAPPRGQPPRRDGIIRDERRVPHGAGRVGPTAREKPDVRHGQATRRKP